MSSRILMIRPCCFGYNPQTAVNNVFQKQTELDPAVVQEKALKEFDHFVALLRQKGVEVLVVEDSPDPHTPDSIFPNNWVSFHLGKLGVLYPMYAPNRRLERKKAVFHAIEQYAPRIRWIDISPHEKLDAFLEGTGSMVFDRKNSKAYACRSPRTNESLFLQICETLAFEPVIFDAVDNGTPVYHTNVLMCMGKDYVVICMEAVTKPEDKQKLLNAFEKNNKTVVEITLEQMRHFAGNMFQVFGTDDVPYLIMSQQAHDSLTPEQIDTLTSFNELLVVPLDTIETHGGGSARCMLAEVI